MSLATAQLFLVDSPQQIESNVLGIVVGAVVVVAAMILLKHFLKLNVFSIIVTIVIGAVIYLAVSGTLFTDIESWFHDIGL
jgi:hypothetical protein